MRIVNTLQIGTVLALLASVPVAAQKGGVFRDSVDVRLVEIEVVVTDLEGLPVVGLSRDDFELRQDGRRLEFTHFVAVEDGSRTNTGEVSADFGDPADLEGAAEGTSAISDLLHLVLYLDLAHLQPGEIGDVVATVKAFLERGLRPGDRVMLARANHSLEILHDFTSEAEQILAELDALEAQSPRGRAAVEFPHLLRQVERAVAQGPDLLARSRDSLPMNLMAQIESYAAETFRELQVTTDNLRRFIPAMAGLAGRREILYVGGTVPTNAPQQLYNAWRSAFGPGSAYQQARGNDTEFNRAENVSPTLGIDVGDFNSLFQAVGEEANRSGVTLHVLDAGGLRRSVGASLGRGEAASSRGGGITYGSRPDSSRRLGNPSTLETMAEATGGRAMVRSRDFEAALEGVSNDLLNYYVLAFASPEDDDATHEVRVKLKGRQKNKTVRHRHGYLSRSSDRLAAEQVVSALVLGEAANSLGIDLVGETTSTVEGQDNIVSLPLTVLFPIEGLSLVEQEDAHRGQVSLFLAYGGLDRGASDVRKIVLQLSFTADELAGAAGQKVEYKIEPMVPAGVPRFAVTLRDDLGLKTSTSVLSVSPKAPEPVEG